MKLYDSLQFQRPSHNKHKTKRSNVTIPKQNVSVNEQIFIWIMMQFFFLNFSYPNTNVDICDEFLETSNLPSPCIKMMKYSMKKFKIIAFTNASHV